ncbi:hypothetical protein [Polaribacter butkevichii]|nr:hypothetical protein [Polaribacter butkevichii]
MTKKTEKIDFWDELNQHQRAEIKQGIKELDEGKRFSYESVLEQLIHE